MLATELTSNGVPVPFDAGSFAPMRDSTQLVKDAEALRARFASDGYVLLRSVLDPEAVLDLRENYFARFDPGLLRTGTPPRDGVFSGTEPPGAKPYGTAGHPAYELVRSDAFDRLTRSAALSAVAAQLLAAPPRLLPRRIVRHFTNRAPVASRAHVDFDYLEHGTDSVVTAWIPIGNYPIACGGIVYLQGSHQVTRGDLDRLREHTDRRYDRRPVSNDLALTRHALGGRWLWTEFRAGDVALHSAHLVHASLDNRSDVMRLSADVRFVPSAAPVDDRWLGDWSADDGF